MHAKATSLLKVSVTGPGNYNLLTVFLEVSERSAHAVKATCN